jgi:hypothetical protein
MRANVDVLPCDDYYRVVKLLHALDRTMWERKVESILESEKLLTVKFRQPSHEFTFGVGMNFISYPLVLTPVV